MFNSNAVQEVIEKIKVAADSVGFHKAVSELESQLEQLGIDDQYKSELERRAYFLTNEYSEKDTKDRMEEAKKRVLLYLDELPDRKMENELLVKILENFYLFLESMFEREPHKKGSVQKEQLEKIQIKNEYDVQFLLYAYLKPIYPAVRAEVSEDTGYHMVRMDIFIDADCVVEVKCTRKGMSLRKLVEEIEADMVHYRAQSICFFIYDKEKIIENPQVFKESNEEKLRDKQIHIIIHQPKIL